MPRSLHQNQAGSTSRLSLREYYLLSNLPSETSFEHAAQKRKFSKLFRKPDKSKGASTSLLKILKKFPAECKLTSNPTEVDQVSPPEFSSSSFDKIYSKLKNLLIPQEGSGAHSKMGMNKRVPKRSLDYSKTVEHLNQLRQQQKLNVGQLKIKAKLQWNQLMGLTLGN